MIKNVIKNLGILLCVVAASGYSQNSINTKLENNLKVNFNGNAKVSVGSRYVGVEFHHSAILPQRISFYYPVANSIDLSTDYWKRDTTFIMAAGLKIGNGQKQWIGLKPYDYKLTPYMVSFNNKDKNKTIDVTYQFCMDKPAMVINFKITNNSNKTEPFEFYTHLETSLKTCHTYALKDKASTRFEPEGSTIYADFNDFETQYVQVFAANAGVKPVSFNSTGTLNSSRHPDKDYWYTHEGLLEEKTHSKDSPGIPAAEFLYKKNLAPHQTMTVIQIIGSCKAGEEETIVKYLLANYKKEVAGYENYVLNKTYKDGVFETGDYAIDHSANWAKAILGANQHYIDGDIIPMPCPAEYNFYFTHDVLLTDLAAVNFDLSRVKHDLTFIAAHSSKDKVIPHAFYWKDSSFVTEFADSDNWNNYWVVITAASYLRHSGDKQFLEFLYPYLTKSIESAMKTKMQDDVMWSYRPDWWDIGNNFGPRVYMTILATKALRDYNFISSVLGKNKSKLLEYDQLSGRMEKQVTNKFWSNKQKYLINYFHDGTVDPHYYIGSLLAADYSMLDKKHMNELIQTAKDKLLDNKVGVYTAYPMDFLEYKKKLGYGDEVGAKYYYFNGGIWPQDNSWFANALIKNGEKKEALHFVKTTMTLEGIMNGPNGQPAMYEVRNADKDNPAVYGSVDKPQFMWAGGWYLYTIYHLFGIAENDWNIRFNPYLPEEQKAIKFSLNANGDPLLVNVTGQGKYIQNISYDNKVVSSAVIPANIANVKNVHIVMGHPEIPYLNETNSSLISSSFNRKNRILLVQLSSFEGHANHTEIISPTKPKLYLINGEKNNKNWKIEKIDKVYKISLQFIQHEGVDKIQIQF